MEEHFDRETGEEWDEGGAADFWELLEELDYDEIIELDVDFDDLEGYEETD